LGRFQVALDGQLVTAFESNAGRALLAYLAVEASRPHNRTALAGLLWPDQPEQAARTSLRQALLKLRQALNEAAAATPYLLSTHQTIQFNPASDYWLDVSAFTTRLAACDTHPHARMETCPDCLARLSQAAGLFAGDFLAGLQLPASLPLEEWVRLMQERLHQQALEIFFRLASSHEERGQYAEGQRYARRQIELEPWREEAHRQLMRALALGGQRSAALAQYETCRRIMATELGAEPAAETQALFEQIRAGTLARSAVPPKPTAAPRAQNLPIPLSSFIGREREQAEVTRLLSRSRLVTLTGVGGCGKTRLALQMAEALGPMFEHGVWLADLARLVSPTAVPLQVAAVFGLYDPTAGSVIDLLADYLRSKHLLLVLDNCEHVLEASARLVEMALQVAPGLRILATSREALGLVGEHVFPLPPLSVPDLRGRVGAPPLTGNEAVRLFVDRACAVQPTFALTDANVLTVAQICQRLDGLPLAIELAAARMRAMSVRQIAARLDDRFQLLAGGSRTLAPRQQTLRALIDWSWDLLTDAERVLLRRLSVFVGGWTLDAAEAVCAEAATVGLSSPAQLPAPDLFESLARLVDKSLVVFEAPDTGARYRMLETIRQYAREKLSTAGEARAVLNRHQHFYLRLVEAAAPHLQRAEQLTWLNRLAAEDGNLQAALEWSMTEAEDNKHTQLGLQMAGALAQFWFMRGRWSEGRQWLERLLALPGAADHTLARAKALNGAGFLAYSQNDLAAARAAYDESLPIWRAGGRNQEMADTLRILGNVLKYQDELSAGQALLDESLAMSRAAGDKEGAAWTLMDLSLQAIDQKDYLTARALAHESLALHREVHNQHGTAILLDVLSDVATIMGDWEPTQALYEESLAIARSLGDKRGIAATLADLGRLEAFRGNYAASQAYLEESLPIWRELGNRRALTKILLVLGFVYMSDKNPSAAQPPIEESVVLAESIGFQPGITLARKYLNRLKQLTGTGLPGTAPWDEKTPQLQMNENEWSLAGSLNQLGWASGGIG
jgi:predicted ATPase